MLFTSSCTNFNHAVKAVYAHAGENIIIQIDIDYNFNNTGIIQFMVKNI